MRLRFKIPQPSHVDMWEEEEVGEREMFEKVIKFLFLKPRSVWRLTWSQADDDDDELFFDDFWDSEDDWLIGFQNTLKRELGRPLSHGESDLQAQSITFTTGNRISTN